MSASGIATAYMIYPTAIVNLTSVGALNAIFGFVFYFMLCTLAIDSAFSILEGIAISVCDKFKLPKKKTTFTIAIIAAIISIVYITGAGVGYLDIVDNWTNQYTLIIIGILETVIVGWFFKPKKVLNEVNKNTNKFKMPSWWFLTSIKILAPLALAFLLGWQVKGLIDKGFRYNKTYDLAAEIIAGWLVTVLVFASGFIIKFVVKKCKKSAEIAEVESNELSWDDLDKQDKYEGEITTLVESEPEKEIEREAVEEPK
jgi:NSS family neurotransmitter:Na+ symporter